jgi:hypothetical protein
VLGKAANFSTVPWDASFAGRSPMFDSVRESAAPLIGSRAWPTLEELQRLVTRRGVRTASGAPLRLIDAGCQSGAGDASYEERIYTRGEMRVRSADWHDLLNVLAWLAWPRTKAALNRRHYEALRVEHGGAHTGTAQRGRVRDALTLFDENGAIVAASDAALIEDVRAFRWKALFWERRERVQRGMRVLMLGHALLEKALRPYVGMSAHALLVPVPESLLAEPVPAQIGALDALVAARLADAAELTGPQALAPLPVLGVPGWWADNQHAAFYDNAQYFRPGRRPAASRTGRA